MRPIDAVRAFLTEEQLCGSTICAAFSGGADSTCLLDCLDQLREECRLTLTAIHVEHGLRGEESLQDAQFCAGFCAERGIPLKIVHCDVRAYAAANRCSIETAARECRYKAFETHCPEGFLATAHTASDQLETMLFRMARGTGLHGMCGIPPKRGRFIRPLLLVTREQIEEAIRKRGLSFVTDSTNLEDHCARNLLRHHAIPALRQCNPAAERNAASLAASLLEDDGYLAKQAALAYAEHLQEDGSLQGITALPPSIRKRCIRLFLQSCQQPDGLYAISQTDALLQRGGSLELVRGGGTIHVSRGNLSFRAKEPDFAECALQLGKNCIFPGIIAEAERISRDNTEKFARIHTMFANCVLDYDIIKGCAGLHSRKPGLFLQGKAHRISIKKWLGECVAPAKRPFIHYLSDENGLLWAEGLGAAKHAAVTERTQTMLYLHIYHETDTEMTPPIHWDTVE